MHCSLIAAISADGFIARTALERSFDWTSEADKAFYVSQIKSADAIIMSLKTFSTFSRYPKGSRWILYTNQPENFVNPAPGVISAEATKETPLAVMARLEQEGVQKIMVAGGSSVYTQFLQAGVVDTVYLTLEPVFFGTGVGLFNQSLGTTLVSLVKTTQLSEQTLLLEYAVVK